LIPPLKSKPIRTVLRWQLFATAAVAAIAGLLAGWDGMVSAALGGGINLAAGVVYALLLGLGVGTEAVPSVGMSLSALIRAEAGKVGLIIGALWLVLSNYKDVVPGAFFSAFVLTVIVFSMAIFVRD
jgi:ATP synthase protein I